MTKPEAEPELTRVAIDSLLDRGAYGTASKMLDNYETFANPNSLKNFLASLSRQQENLDKHHEGEILALTLNLIKHGSDVNYNEDGETPLLNAISNGYPNKGILRGIVQLLLEEGKAEVTEETINHAKLSGDEKMVNLLKIHADAKLLEKFTAKDIVDTQS